MNERILAVVGETFIVICGVAVTQFFVGGAVIDSDPAFRTEKDKPPERYAPWYVVCYMLALIIVVTLVLRFLIGSNSQLVQDYNRTPDIRSFHRFVTDISFLMFFGAFLVGAAQSKSVRAFMGWLALTSAAGAGWSLIALWRGHSDLAYWWLCVNFAQFVLTGLLSWWCRPVDDPPGKGKVAARWALILAGVWFMIIFVFDLEKIILGKLIF